MVCTLKLKRQWIDMVVALGDRKLGFGRQKKEGSFQPLLSSAPEIPARWEQKNRVWEGDLEGGWVGVCVRGPMA